MYNQTKFYGGEYAGLSLVFFSFRVRYLFTNCFPIHS